MRKEVVFAVLAGGCLGAILAFGIWRANSAIKEAPLEEELVQDTFSPQSSSTPTPSTGDTPGITLAKPNNEDVITESPTVFSGVTQPNSWVVISTDNQDFTTKSTSSGSFSAEVKLSAGVNQIQITAFDQKGVSHQTSLILVFSKELASQ